MSINPFPSSPLSFGARSDTEDYWSIIYNNNASSPSIDMDAPPSIHHRADNMFFPELSETPDPLDPYGEIDWPIYDYNNPFTSSPAPPLDHDNTSSVGTIDEPFSPISDARAVGPSLTSSAFKLSSPYDLGHTHLGHGHIGHDFNSLNLDAAAAGSPLSGFPDTPGLYDPLYGYEHLSQFAYGAATDVPGRPPRSQGVDMSVGQVPLIFTFPPALVIADQERPSAATQVKEEREASPASSTSTARSAARRKAEATNDDADEDEDSHDKPPKRGKPAAEYRCPECSAVFNRSYNRNKHVASVHEGKKDNVCPHDKCEKAFARKHDLKRHIQSSHTTLGSPRRHPPASGEPKTGRVSRQKS